MSLPLTEELSGNANNAGTIRFFKRYNEYLSVEYAKHHELNFKAPMNKGTERRIKIGVYEDTPAPGFAYIVFVQAGK